MVILRLGLKCGASLTCRANCEKKKTSTPARRPIRLVSQKNLRTAERDVAHGRPDVRFQHRHHRKYLQ